MMLTLSVTAAPVATAGAVAALMAIILVVQKR
jgi:hypothetical protein